MQKTNQENAKKSDIPLCYQCKKQTDLICHGCGIGLCAKHNGYINHHFYCGNCFVKEQKRGIMKMGILLSILLIMVIVVYFTIIKPI